MKKGSIIAIYENQYYNSEAITAKIERQMHAMSSLRK
jgi:hypothetical protein